MRIFVDTTPIETFPYLVVPPGGERDDLGRRLIETAHLDILCGGFESKNLQVDALIISSDLQGTVLENGRTFLLGEKLPSFLSLVLKVHFPALDPARVGVVLCGDLYAHLDKRGGFGDARPVWQAFLQQFGWVAGVAGNHDDFGDKTAFEAFRRTAGIYYLHREIRKIGKATLGGISGIIGDPEKPHRMPEADFLASLKKLLLQQPEMILLHHGPDYPPLKQAGAPEISRLIEGSPPNLVVCGHHHWPVPLVEWPNGAQVLNVDKRVVVLIKQ